MKKTRYTDEQIGYALRQAEAGKTVTDICREMGISQQTFYRWRRKFAGMGVAELRRLKQLEKENARLKQLVADLTLDKHMLQEVLRKRSEAGPEASPRDVSDGRLPDQPAASLPVVEPCTFDNALRSRREKR